MLGGEPASNLSVSELALKREAFDQDPNCISAEIGSVPGV